MFNMTEILNTVYNAEKLNYVTNILSYVYS